MGKDNAEMNVALNEVLKLYINDNVTGAFDLFRSLPAATQKYFIVEANCGNFFAPEYNFCKRLLLILLDLDKHTKGA